MACYHPLKAFYRVRSDGKKDIKFPQFDTCLPFYVDDEGIVYGSKIELPCGQCVGCRLEYSRQWATRCVLEALQYEHNYFITLTYSPEYINLCQNNNIRYDTETGEYLDSFSSYSLVPEHLTKFLKLLRRHFKYHYDFDGIRFYACGEYGDKNLRPHFHLILFNCPIPDLVFLKSSFNGDSYYSSDIISNIWKKGFVCITDCNYSTCSYVARYMMKKQKGLNSSYYSDLGLIPPFCRTSRNPGIARSFYDSEKEKIYTYDQIVITDSKGLAKKVRPPSYFDRLYDIDCPEKLKEIKEKRDISSKTSRKLKLSRTSLSDYDTFLSVQEDIYLDKAKKLVRPIE